jgi:CRP-like cAMP-binding protein
MTRKSTTPSKPSLKKKSASRDGASRDGHAADPRQNTVLAALPKDEYDRLLPHLEFHDLAQSEPLFEAGEAVQHGYFVVDGMVSVVIVLQSGENVEVAMIGYDGFAGSSLLLGASLSPWSGIVQMQGGAFRIKGDSLKRAVANSPRLRELLQRGAQFEAAQMSQSAACNQFHEIDARLARWLLTAQDRVNSPILPLTHEFLSQMLGCNRSTVTLAARVLQRAGPSPSVLSLSTWDDIGLMEIRKPEFLLTIVRSVLNGHTAPPQSPKPPMPGTEPA